MTSNPNTILIGAAESVAAEAGDLIEDHYQVEIITDPGSERKLSEAVRALTPQAVVIDSEWTKLDWVAAVHRIASQDPRPGVLVLGRVHREADLLAAFREGADAYLPQSAMAEDLLSVLRAVGRGWCCFPQVEAGVLREHMRYLELGRARKVTEVYDGIARLTVREKEVFPLLADGKSVKETARTLGISPKTVETHKYHIMQKLGFASMADFTKMAMIKDLLPLRDISSAQ